MGTQGCRATHWDQIWLWHGTVWRLHGALGWSSHTFMRHTGKRSGRQKISTIEAMQDHKVGQAVQAAWQEIDVVQCGYCQSGQIMAATALLANNKSPTDADIDAAMSGNICRCGTYPRIRAAIHAAASKLA